MNDLLENAKRNSKITLEEFFFEFYSKILEFEQETKIKENKNIYITKYISTISWKYSVSSYLHVL